MTGPKTVTSKQLAANRRSAQLSTGPRTPDGKARSRWNALKHGVLAKAVIPEPLQPYESRQEFDRLLAALCDDFAPQSAVEEMLVETIATCYWRLARLVRAEAAAISQRLISAHDDYAHARAHAEDDASYWAGFDRPHTLRERVDRLYRAMSHTRDVREFMSELDSHWLDAPEDQLFEAAEAHLADLRRQLAEQESHELAAHQGVCSIPDIENALNLSRYETRLHQQLSRALNELELIQRRRAGAPVPPPLNITIADAS